MIQPLLVMIHGLVGSLRYFAPEQRITAARIAAWELLGYGSLRDIAADRLTLSAQVDYLADCISGRTDRPVWVLGHSMGGALAMLLADRFPALVAGIINVEGNFTVKDAFWSASIRARTLAAWEARYEAMMRDVPGWLAECGVTPSPLRVAWTEHILAWQPARTVHAMSAALVDETEDPGYLQAVRRVLERGVPVHLIAGGKSAANWDVPDFVRATARSYVELPGVGHLMMLEQPDVFCRVVEACLPP